MKRIAAVAAACLVLIAGYFAIAPRVALSQLATAVQQRDPNQLARQVDFGQLRQNFKLQVADAMAASWAGAEQNLLASLAVGVATRVADSAVDYLITPEGIARLLEGEQLLRFEPSRPPQSRPGRGPQRGVERDPFRDARLSYDSLQQVSVRVATEHGEDVRLILRRQGFDWKLVNLLPGEAKPG